MFLNFRSSGYSGTVRKGFGKGPASSAPEAGYTWYAGI
jgi:hypothetical protein